MPSALARLILFLSAYAPLLTLFAILNSFHRTWAAWTCGGVAAASLIALWWFWRTAGSIAAEDITVLRVSRKDEDVLTYFVTFVVPFAVAPLDGDRVALALLFFLALIGLLYLRAGMYRVHPILLLCGLHLYELDTADPAVGTIACFSKMLYLDPATLPLRPIAPSTYIHSPIHP
jgi:hypothetical protein